MSCPDCFSGSVHDGKPKGEVTMAYGLDTYVVEPSKKPVRGIVVIIPDAFGWEFVNQRILADHYAEKGSFKVYVPDFMNGTSQLFLFAIDLLLTDDQGHAAPLAVMDRMRIFFTTNNVFAKM
jgi:dienelactone hydrolase